MELLPYLFVDLLNKYESGELKVKNVRLKEAFNGLIDCLEDFVTVSKVYSKKFERSVFERVESKEKSFPATSIKKVNKILSTCPIYLQLDFKGNFEIASKTKEFSSADLNWSRLYNQITEIRTKQNKKSFKHLQFAPYLNHLAMGGVDYPRNDEDIKAVLVRGLTLYFQKIIFGDKVRIMRCRWSGCNKWFLSKRKNSLTCDSGACYEVFWRDFKGGARKRADAMFKNRNPNASKEVIKRRSYQRRKKV